jgi:hypothetical protein
LLLVAQLFVTLNVCSTFTAKAAALSFKFAGVPFSPGSTVRANVPLSVEEKSYAGQGGNPVPQSAVAVLATPANFDPRKSWPVLVTCSTSDFKRQNRDDLVDFYRRVGLAEGWVLLAGDGPQHARNDTAAWRAAMTLAAIDALHHSFAGVGEVADGLCRLLRRSERRRLHRASACEKRLSHHRNLPDRRE